MATAPQRPLSPAAQRAQFMREHFNPVAQRLGSGANSVLDFLGAHPAVCQGVYYVLTGLWPWVSLRSFTWVTGEKADLWLVQTVGLLAAVIGVSLCVAAWRREYTWSVLCLAVGSAAAFAFTDVLFVVQRQISLIYLLDAAVEVGLIVLWAHGWQKVRAPAGGAPVRAAVRPAVAPGTPVAAPATPYAVPPAGAATPGVAAGQARGQ
jgi:hypothetical protein